MASPRRSHECYQCLCHRSTQLASFRHRGPDGPTAAVTATLVDALLERLIAGGAPDDLLTPVMIVLALSGGADRHPALRDWA